MNLYDFCEQKYKQGNRERFNGITANPSNIAGMINCVYKVFSSFFNDVRSFPDTEKLLGMSVSSGEMFNKDSMADLVALLFDVVTERNHNAVLWGKHKEIAAEITHICNVLFHGKMAAVYSDGMGAIVKMGDNYPKAKNILEEELKSPFEGLY